MELGFKPGAAEWEARMLPLCSESPLSQRHYCHLSLFSKQSGKLLGRREELHGVDVVGDVIDRSSVGGRKQLIAIRKLPVHAEGRLQLHRRGVQIRTLSGTHPNELKDLEQTSPAGIYCRALVW